MTIFDKYGNDCTYRGGRKQGSGGVLLRIRYSDLAELFNCSISTIKRWARTKQLDPYSLRDIIKKYNEINKIG